VNQLIVFFEQKHVMGKQNTTRLKYACVLFYGRLFLLIREHGEHCFVDYNIKALIGVGEVCSVSLFHCYVLLDIVSRDIFFCFR